MGSYTIHHYNCSINMGLNLIQIQILIYIINVYCSTLYIVQILNTILYITTNVMSFNLFIN